MSSKTARAGGGPNNYSDADQGDLVPCSVDGLDVAPSHSVRERVVLRNSPTAGSEPRSVSFGDLPGEMGHHHPRLGSPLIAQAFHYAGPVPDGDPAKQTCGTSRSADTMSAAIGSPTCSGSPRLNAQKLQIAYCATIAHKRATITSNP